MFLSEETRQKVLIEWNHTDTAYPYDKTVHQLFEEQVKKTPNNIAIIFEKETLTYKDLNERANQIAHILKDIGLKPGVLVAVTCNPSLEMVACILGVLKAGGAYVPIDPSYPDERIRYMLKDTLAFLTLTNDMYKERLRNLSLQSYILTIENDLAPKHIQAQPVTNLETHITSDNLAYVIYTSGTTGQPKGVMIKHKGIVSLVKNINYISINPDDLFIQLANIAFDAATFEIWGPLLNGAKLLIPINKLDITSDAILLKKTIRSNKVTILWLTKTLFDQLLLADDATFQHLKYLLIGGEALNKELVKKLINSKYSPENIINGYGPTENTTFSCTFNVSKNVIKNINSIPIGIPLTNRKAYILDSCFNPLAIGITGELYVGGEGLAQGYLNQPELTAEKFVDNPFQTREEKSLDKNARLYRTGDLCRWLEDGNIEYVGRIDNQVKIRGFRIEPGEIENILLNHSMIKEATVIAREDTMGIKKLVAYIVFKKQSIKPRELSYYLKKILPDYMVPSAFVVLEKLPLTPNGKIDREALPVPQWQSLCVTNYVAPRTPCEKQLAQICAKLLGVEKIGCEDDLLAAGVNSLLLMQLKVRIRNKWGVELSFNEILNAPTVQNIAQHIINHTKLSKIIKKQIVKSYSPSDPVPLTFQQEQIWWFEKLVPKCRAYQAQFTLHVRGKLRKCWLEASITEIIKRQAIFRTTFVEKDGQLQQVIHEPWPVQLTEVDLRNLSSAERKHKIKELLYSDFQEKIDISSLPLVRWKLYHLEESYWIFAHMEHHLIHDGWTVNVFLRELQALYESFSKGKTLVLPPLSCEYADYAIWQRNEDSAQIFKEQVDYWTKQLSEIDGPLVLATDKPRPKIQTFEGKCLRLSISSEIMEMFKYFQQSHHTTLFSVLYTVFGLLLFRYTQQEKFVLATAAANRVFEETEHLCGMFVNSLPICLHFSNDFTVLELLQDIQHRLGEGHDYSGVPFQKLVNKLQCDRDLSYNPIFQASFSFHDSKLPSLKFGGLEAEFYLEHNDTAKFDLNIIGIPFDDTITLLWEYNTDLFQEQTIKRMMKHYINLLRMVLKYPQEKISRLSFLSNKEYQQLLKWNNTDVAYPSDKTIHQLFEEQTQKTPNNIAVVFEDQPLTYQELNRKANQLAHYLRDQGIQQDTLVAIAVERSLEMIVGILSILKAGGAYVPIDPTYPQNRIKFMLEDANAPILLTQQTVLDQLPKAIKAKMILLDQDQEKLAHYPTTNPLPITHSHHLAYVIYTSGSTGKPKGVMVEHKSVNRLIFNQNYVHLSPSSVIAQAANVSFDAATFEIWGALLLGGRFVIIPKEEALSLDKLRILLKHSEINTAFVTTALFNRLLNEQPNIFSGLKYLFVGGEIADVEKMKQQIEQKNVENFIHVYGPTESTTFSIYYPLERAERFGDNVPIGQPITNTQAYILDTYLNLVPIGVAGELYIGGEGLARGYLNRPDLTAERFIKNPFQTEEEKKQGKSARLYKTGDLCRWLEDGNIEYIGRIDDQVKIRGFRIELGEIEAALLQHPQVKEAVVIAREDSPGDKRLVGYVVFKESEEVDRDKDRSKNKDKVKNQGFVEGSELRAHIQKTLPDYMIPSAFVALETILLTPNGKVDRKNLPAPEYRGDEKAFVAPSTDLEEKMVTIWSEVLSIDISKVGTQDNFFDLGGNSLLLVQVSSKIEKVFQRKVPVTELFRYTTITSLCQYLQNNVTQLKSGQPFSNQRYDKWQAHLKNLRAQNSAKVIS